MSRRPPFVPLSLKARTQLAVSPTLLPFSHICLKSASRNSSSKKRPSPSLPPHHRGSSSKIQNRILLNRLFFRIPCFFFEEKTDTIDTPSPSWFFLEDSKSNPSKSRVKEMIMGLE
ncbi:hypothetical protein L2E82_04547 [Cichorium intybus]|uniref:Uncharacterized protein n=1 Tax=Cichorium intybus TaxID=13427 RepID=A0ACB9H586_CICIN|nr:hypothetical protein L2E82_04547 [Cichorium intybus]